MADLADCVQQKWARLREGAGREPEKPPSFKWRGNGVFQRATPGVAVRLAAARLFSQGAGANATSLLPSKALVAVTRIPVGQSILSRLGGATLRSARASEDRINLTSDVNALVCP